MAHHADRGTRRLAPSSASTLSQWGVAVACSAFFWALVSVVSRVSPTDFQVPVRGPGVVRFSASFTIVTPTVDQLILLVCSISVLAILELKIQRLSYVKRGVLMLPALLIASFVLSPTLLLSLGAVGTIAGILYLVLHSSELLGVPPGRIWSSILVLLTGSTAVIFSVSMVRWTLNAVDGEAPLIGWTWSASLLGLKLLNQVYWLMPGLILLLFIIWPLKLLLEASRRDLRRYLSELSTRVMVSGDHGDDWLASNRVPLVLLLVSLGGSLFVGLYPYLHAINPGSIVVGYDVRVKYGPFLRHMLSQDPLGAVAYSLQNDRTAFLLFQYLLALLTGSAGLALRVVPALLAALLTVSTYLFVRTGVKDRLLAATASLFAAFSLLVASGTNGGLNADWLAMSEVLVFLSLLFVGLNKSDKRYIALSVVASVLILFTHPWTWLATLGVLGAYALFTAVRAFMIHDRKGLRFELASIGSVLTVNLAVDGAKHLLGGLSGVRDVYSSTSSTLAFANIPKVLDSLAYTLRYYLGGTLDNSLVIVFALMGVITLPSFGSRMNRLLLSWMAAASGGILLYGSSMWFLQARIILLAPLQVLGAMGFLSLLRYLTGLMGDGGQENRRLVKAFIALAYISVFGAMLGCALQSVGALYTGS